MDIVSKIKQSNLVGRGGGCFVTAVKWEMVKNATGKRKFVVCNAAEGEPDVMKDGFILKNYPEKVIKGMMLAMEYLSAEKGIIYLNPQYFREMKKLLTKAIGDRRIELFRKPKNAGYIGGEETSALNCIEGRRIEPRLRPPFPPTNGLYDCPTLVNNVETFYNVALVDQGKFKNKRFYSIDGDCLWSGVYELPDNLAIRQILEETNNYPKFPFFVQVGGGASGEVLNESQLNVPASGAGSLTIYSLTKYKPIEILRKWVDFFAAHSCGQCTPCREGTYRLKEILYSENPDWELFEDLLDNLSESSFCGLGCAVPIPIRSYIHNVLRSEHMQTGLTCGCFTDYE